MLGSAGWTKRRHPWSLILFLSGLTQSDVDKEWCLLSETSGRLWGHRAGLLVSPYCGKSWGRKWLIHVEQAILKICYLEILLYAESIVIIRRYANQIKRVDWWCYEIGCWAIVHGLESADLLAKISLTKIVMKREGLLQGFHTFFLHN